MPILEVFGAIVAKTNRSARTSTSARTIKFLVMKIRPSALLAATAYVLSGQSIGAATFDFLVASPTFFEGQWGITDYWAIQGGTGPDDGTADIPDGLDTLIIDRNPNPVNGTKLVLDGGGTPQPLTVAGITATGAAGIDIEIKTFDLIVGDLQVIPSAEALDIHNERDQDLIINGVLSGSGDLVLSRAGGFSDGVTSDEVIRLGGTSPNTFSGSLSLLNTSNGAQPSFWVADKVGAFGEASSILIAVNGTGGGTNIAQLVLTANAIGGEGAIDDDITSVELGLNAEFNVAAGVDEVIGSGLLTVDGVGVVADGTYDNTESWITGDGTITVGSPSTDVLISSFTEVGGGVWELTMVGAATTDYEFRSSTDLNFDPGTLVESLLPGVPAVGTIGGSNDSVLTTDGNGDGRVRMTLAGPRNFVVVAVPAPLAQ